MADIAHRLIIRMIVESVETEMEWGIPEYLHVDVGQGYYVGRPTENLED